MRALLSRIFSNRGLRGPVITLASASSVALGIAMLSDLVIARLYEPEEFGVYGYFANIMGILITFTSLRYEDALMLEKEDRDAGTIAWLGLLILSFFVVVTAVMSLWRKEIAAMMGMPGVAPYLLLVPIALLAMRGTKLAELWLTRKRQFRRTSASQIANTTTMSAWRIAVGVPPVQAGTSGLVHGHIAGNIVPLFILWPSIWRKSGKVLRSAFSWRRIGAAAKRYRNFPLFSTPATAAAAVVLRMPIFFIPFFFEANKEMILGFYHFAFARISIPFSYFARAVAQVFFVGAAEARSEGRLDVITEIVHRRLVMVALFPMLVILTCGPDLFGTVFGEQWREAGVYARFLVPWSFMSTVCSPLTRLFDVTQRQRLDFLMGCASLGIVYISLLIGGRSGDIQLFLALLCAGGCLARFAQLYIFTHLAQVRYKQILAPYLRYLIFSLPGIALIIGVTQMAQPMLTVVASIVAAALYGALLLWKDRLFR